MTDNQASQEEPISRLKFSLCIILTGSFFSPLLMNSSTLAIPSIADEMQLSAIVVSWFTLVQVLASACFVLPAGKLADRFGRRKIFIVGMIVSCLACFVGGFAFNGPMILLARALQGVGASLIFASAIALLVSVPPEAEKIKMMGVYISVVYVGVVGGPLFGGFVVQYFDWRWVFIIPGLVFFGLIIAGSMFMNWERYGDRNTRLKALDVSLYAGALVLLAFGMFDAGSVKGQTALVIGALSLAAFCWFQVKREDPLLQIRLFTQNRTFSILGSAHFMTYIAIYSLPFTLTLFLQYLKGIDAQTTGYILLSQALCTALVAAYSGWLSERFHARNLIMFGAVLFVCSCVMLTFLSPSSPFLTVVLAIALVGISIGLMDAPILSTTMSTVSPDLLGSASATLNGLRTLGGFVGIGFMSYLMGFHIGDATILPPLYPQLMLAINQFFLIAAVFSLLTISLLVYGVISSSKPIV